MSAINNNTFASGFPDVAAGSEFGRPGAGAAAGAPLPGAKDSIGPVVQNGGSTAPDFGFTTSGGSSDGGLAGFSNIMNGFIGALQNFVASLGQQFGLTSGPSQPAPGQSYFTNATSSSVGDPHDAFDGTQSSGSAVDQKWDDMQSHANLLDSDSFDGGYSVSTLATAPNERGVTLNASASVALNGGATNITMNGNGSYSITSAGRDVALAQGQAVPLGNGESVTLGADKSLTVADRNAAGGSISTVLAANASGGVDVKNAAANVDLGGYLVSRTDVPQYPVPGPRPYDPPAAPRASDAFALPTDAALRDRPIEFA